MNSHHHSRDDKEMILVAFEGDVCPYCELLKKCARLEAQVKSEPIFRDPAEEYKAFGSRFDSIEERLTRVEHQIEGGSQAEAVPDRPELGQVWEPKKVAEGTDAKGKRLTIYAMFADEGGIICSFEEIQARFKWSYLEDNYRYVGMKTGRKHDLQRS